MLNVSQINHIRDLAQSGRRPAEIIRETRRDPKTVRKYLAEEDFSPKPPRPVIKPSKLDPYKPTIDAWMEMDRHLWHKQQHTAKRIYDLLREQYPDFDSSYPTVGRYVRERRSLLKQERGFQELVWHSGYGVQGYQVPECNEELGQTKCPYGKRRRPATRHFWSYGGQYGDFQAMG